jgi:Ni/Co efflux regulator RcnB
MKYLATAALALALAAGAAAAQADPQNQNGNQVESGRGDHGGGDHGGGDHGGGGQHGGGQGGGGGQTGGQVAGHGGPPGGAAAQMHSLGQATPPPRIIDHPAGWVPPQGGGGGRNWNGDGRHDHGGGAGQGGGGQADWHHGGGDWNHHGGDWNHGGQNNAGDWRDHDGGRGFVGGGGDRNHGGGGWNHGGGPGAAWRGAPGWNRDLRGRDEGRGWFQSGQFPHQYQAQRRYHGYWRYPHNWYAHTWYFGEFLPFGWFAPEYYLDWSDYDLPEPPIGCEWVREGDDALLVNVYTGEVLTVWRGVFW